MKIDRPIEPVFSLRFQLKYSLVMVAGSVLTSLILFLYLDQGLGNGYFESLVTLSTLEESVPNHLILSFGVQLILIFLITFTIHLFVSHKIAGPVYRYELSLTSILKDDLRFDVRTRQGDQLKPMVHALNDFLESMRLVYGEAGELKTIIDKQLVKDSVDLEAIRNQANQLREALGRYQPNSEEGAL